MKLNLNLFKRLLLINRYSGEEHEMISFLINYCTKIPHVSIQIDKLCNLFITKNSTNPEFYPLIVAHTDTVLMGGLAREIVQNDDIITARYVHSGLPSILGADDTNGLLVIIQLLQVIPDIKVLFSTQEESGGQGSDWACSNYQFFSNVSYILQADRHGTSDLITHTNGYDITSDEFLKDIAPLMKHFGYKEARGTFTDVGILSPYFGISGVNISCGYFSEHTTNESCSIKGLTNCLNFMYSIVTLLKKDKQYTIEIPKQGSTKDLAPIEYNAFYDGYDHCRTCSNMDCMRCPYYDCY